MSLSRAARKKLASAHKAVYLEVSNNWVCKHDRLLWPCPAAKLLHTLQEADRRNNYAKGKNKSA